MKTPKFHFQASFDPRRDVLVDEGPLQNADGLPVRAQEGCLIGNKSTYSLPGSYFFASLCRMDPFAMLEMEHSMQGIFIELVCCLTPILGACLFISKMQMLPLLQNHKINNKPKQYVT